mmetsp:Transcript_13617/g.33372  ORF Transcript_13617/g.33372 Transcript_13617/m.33372 type:complete len:205 (-) Transcript_13617:23-637(-)
MLHFLKVQQKSQGEDPNPSTQPRKADHRDAGVSPPHDSYDDIAPSYSRPLSYLLSLSCAWPHPVKHRPRNWNRLEPSISECGVGLLVRCRLRAAGAQLQAPPLAPRRPLVASLPESNLDALLVAPLKIARLSLVLHLPPGEPVLVVLSSRGEEAHLASRRHLEPLLAPSVEPHVARPPRALQHSCRLKTPVLLPKPHKHDPLQC